MAFAETAELAVRIDLKGNATAGIDKLQRKVNGLGSSLARTGKGVGQIGTGFARAGLVVGGAVVTGLAAAAKNAIDFQDAFAGVRKTVEGTPAELQALDDALRSLSTRIPINYTDLAGIAQEAGALGVPTSEVAGFTEVVARLSAATVGLTTEAAAEAFGKLGNVLNLHGKDFERAGSALVALGNAGASSEGDIVEVAKRFGAAGAQAKLSAAQVLGFSSAIASMGVEPEAAGSSLSRLFNNITKYIGTGNKKINAFAKVSGKSVKDFSKLFAKDASGAVQLFLTKLSKLDRFKAAALLKQAGITNVRDINAVLLLARGHEELARQLDLSTDAYKKNTELAEVSRKRFDTLKARLTELKNAFVLAGVTLADGFLPALGRTVEKLQKFLALDTNRSALKNIGEDIGKAIDGIDWAQVLSGARDFVTVMKDALSIAKGIFDVVNKLPTDVKAAAAALLILNKASGGLLASGAGNVVGGLAGAAAQGVGSRLPGVGRLFAQPVFVTNWPLGGVGGAGGAAGGAAAGKAGGLAGLLKVVGGVFAIAAVAGIADAIHEEIKAGPDIPASQLSWPWGPKNTPKILPELGALFGSTNGIFGGTPTAPTAPPPPSGPNRGDRPLSTGPNASSDKQLAHIERSTTKTNAAIEKIRQNIIPSLGTHIPSKLERTENAVTVAGIASALASKRAGDNTKTAVSAGAVSMSGAAKEAGRNTASAVHSTAGQIVAGFAANRPVVNVAVNVTATQVTKSVTIQNRYGPGGGSAYQNIRQGAD